MGLSGSKPEQLCNQWAYGIGENICECNETN